MKTAFDEIARKKGNGMSWPRLVLLWAVYAVVILGFFYGIEVASLHMLDAVVNWPLHGKVLFNGGLVGAVVVLAIAIRVKLKGRI